MRLSQFIDHAKKEIIAESLAYAASITVLKDATTAILCDHLPLVLTRFAATWSVRKAVENRFRSRLGIHQICLRRRQHKHMAPTAHAVV